MKYELTPTQAEAAYWLIERSLPQLRFELARTEDPAFRAFIHSHLDTLEELERTFAPLVAPRGEPAAPL